VEWVVGPRPGVALPDRAALDRRFGEAGQRIHLLDGPSLDVSSSEIRRRVAARHVIRYLVPRAVEELIVERGLYRR
jgi:nicotinate-nucleotide adenylyltransferase